MPIIVKCNQCGYNFKVKPGRVKRGVRFCSYACIWSDGRAQKKVIPLEPGRKKKVKPVRKK